MKITTTRNTYDVTLKASDKPFSLPPSFPIIVVRERRKFLFFSYYVTVYQETGTEWLDWLPGEYSWRFQRAVENYEERIEQKETAKD